MSLPTTTILGFKDCTHSFFPPPCSFCTFKSLQQCILVLTFVSSVLSNMFFKVRAWGPWFTSCWKHSSCNFHITPKRHSYIPSYHLYCWISLNKKLTYTVSNMYLSCFFFLFLNISFHAELESTNTLWLPLTLTKWGSVWS